MPCERRPTSQLPSELPKGPCQASEPDPGEQEGSGRRTHTNWRQRFLLDSVGHVNMRSVHSGRCKCWEVSHALPHALWTQAHLGKSWTCTSIAFLPSALRTGNFQLSGSWVFNVNTALLHSDILSQKTQVWALKQNQKSSQTIGKQQAIKSEQENHRE